MPNGPRQAGHLSSRGYAASSIADAMAKPLGRPLRRHTTREYSATPECVTTRIDPDETKRLVAKFCPPPPSYRDFIKPQ